jgi:elongation factor P
MFYPISQLQNKVIIDNGDPCVVTQFVFSRRSQGQAVAKCTLKNLKTGVTIVKTYHGNDKVEAAEVKFVPCQFLYKQADSYAFMNNETFEQFELSEELIGDQKYYLVEGLDVTVQMFEGNPITLKLPPKMVLEVVETDPGVRGDTATGGNKPATLDTGLVLNVPLFINIGDKIRINTDTLEYCERAQ